MKVPLLFIAIATGLVLMSFAAGLPDAARQHAEQFETAMRQYEASVAAQKKIALDQYVATLTAARRIEEGAKRAAGVAAIDAELAAAKTGTIAGNTPPELPAHLGNARAAFIASTRQAATSNESLRKSTADRYIKILTNLQATYARAKDDAAIAAMEAEKKRVMALIEASPKP